MIDGRSTWRQRRRVTEAEKPVQCGHMNGDTMDPRQARVWLCNDCGGVIGVALIEDGPSAPESPEQGARREAIACLDLMIDGPVVPGVNRAADLVCAAAAARDLKKKNGGGNV